MPRAAASDLHGGEVRTVKHCPPFIDAMSHGFIMPLPCDVTVGAGALVQTAGPGIVRAILWL